MKILVVTHLYSRKAGITMETNSSVKIKSQKMHIFVHLKHLIFRPIFWTLPKELIQVEVMPKVMVW